MEETRASESISCYHGIILLLPLVRAGLCMRTTSTRNPINQQNNNNTPPSFPSVMTQRIAPPAGLQHKPESKRPPSLSLDIHSPPKNVGSIRPRTHMQDIRQSRSKKSKERLDAEVVVADGEGRGQDAQHQERLRARLLGFECV